MGSGKWVVATSSAGRRWARHSQSQWCAAIAAFGTAEGASKPSSPAAASSLTGVAEHRPITVMFFDLVGSTPLAAKLDAEDWRDLVGAYLDAASEAVTQMGGRVAKTLGDGLMALFGHPIAQENDSERAIRAALAIQRALVEINARNASRGAPGLSARIGLDSGQVVVDATGEVFGEAPNIAARVESAAEPGSILITAAVQRQTAGLFVAEDRGQHELKGVSAPMTLYRVIRASGAGRRGGGRALTSLVGRDEELDLLAGHWDRARQGEGQLALIVGEPGIGKSRLINEFHARLGETPHTWVEWSSSQLLQNTPLHPIVEWGRQRFGADLPAEQRLAGRPTAAAASRGNVVLFCGLGNHVGLRGLPGGAEGIQTAILLAMPSGKHHGSTESGPSSKAPLPSDNFPRIALKYLDDDRELDQRSELVRQPAA
jgi:class 3 adenylate cyclase